MFMSPSSCVVAIYFLLIITPFLTYLGVTVKSVNNEKGSSLNDLLCNSLSQRDQCVLVCFGYLKRLQLLLEVMMSTAQKMKLSIKYFFRKCDQICKKLRIWSHLLKKFLMKTSFFV